jgi:hypothetical protein
MPTESGPGGNMRVSYAKGHESYGEALTELGAPDNTDPGHIPHGSEGANERLTVAKGHAGNVETDGLPSAEGGIPTHDSTAAGSSGALGNVRTPPSGTASEDLA